MDLSVRIVKPMILIIFWLLLFALASAQQQDSTFRVDSLSGRGTFTNWKTFIAQKGRTLDSIKRNQAWERATPQKSEVDTAIRQLQFLYADMRNFQQTLSRVSSSGILRDSVGRPKLQIADTSVQQTDRKDSLLLMEREANYLISEITHQLKLFDKLREEILLRESRQAPSELWIPRLKKVADKNLTKDGVSAPLLSLSAWHGQFVLLLLSFLYFYWIYKAARTSRQKDELPLYKSQPLHIPILKTALLFLILFPLSYPTIPVWTLEIVFFAIFIIMYLLLYKELSSFKRRVIHALFFYYLLLILTNLFLHEGPVIQGTAILANVVGIIILWNFGKKTDRDNPIGFLPMAIVWLLIGCHMASVLLNVLGYLNVARIASLTATLGLVQALSLRTFRDMLLHDLESKFDRPRSNSFFAHIDQNKALRSLDRIIVLCSLALVLVVLLSNLHLSTEAWRHLRQFLQRQLTIAGMNIGYGDVITAGVVLWLANKLQRSLGTFVSSGRSAQRGSVFTLLPLFRLIIVVIGFLAALGMLGLGLDKLTVIIGALSVGIGLGLQNVVNNFVSGIILIFERPFKLGDYVELADKKGQVVEIGIRSSTLVADTGARVIIPNGDLLSGRLVNWTLVNSETYFNMTLSVEEPVDLPSWKKELITLAKSQQEVSRTAHVRITTTQVDVQRYLLSIQVALPSEQVEVFRGKYLEAIKKSASVRDLKVSSTA